MNSSTFPSAAGTQACHDAGSGSLPLVSIILVCRNAQDTIRRSLDSVLALDYPHIEYVVQDGASTDGTLDIVREYQSRFGTAMKLVSEPDSSGADAFHRALDRCTGTIIGSCLSDEELLPHAVSHAVQLFLEHPDAGVIHGDIYNTDIKGNILAENPGGDFDLAGYLSHAVSMHFAASFFRAAALKDAGLFNHDWFDDFDFWCRLSLHTKFFHTPALLSKYAIHEDQISEHPEKLLKSIPARARFIDQFLACDRTPAAVRSRRREILINFNTWAAQCMAGKGLPTEANTYAAKVLRMKALPPDTPEKTAKILLVSLPGLCTGDEPLFPLGIGYLLAAVRQDRPAQAVHYQLFEHAVQQLPEIIDSFRPELIGLTCTSFNRGNVRKTCEWLRKHHPKMKILLGGVHVSFLPEQALREYGADVVVIGEGEQTLRELCNALDGRMPLDRVNGIAYLDQGTLTLTPSREPLKNLDELPLPDFSFAAHLMRQSGMGFVISSRGCPVRCCFCSTGTYWGQKVRVNSPKRVVDEIQSLINNFGVKKIFFHDDTFNLNPARVKEICAEITARKLTIEWGVSCRVHPVSREMIDTMVAAGCRHICWGIESGSEEMLKVIDKKITLDQIRNAFELCRKHLGSISVGAFMMVGNQGESDKSITESISFINTLPLTDSPSTSILYVLPGTKLYEDLRSRKTHLDKYWSETDDILHYTSEHTLGKLQEWAEMVSRSGDIQPFNRDRHFWNNVLFGTIPRPAPPIAPFLTSELNRIIPPEIKDDELYFLITKLAAESDIRTVLEIGSSAGGGSTEAFVKGLRENPHHPQLFCMEVSKPRFAELRQRYLSESFIHCYNVSSVPISSFPSEKELELFYHWIPSALNDYPLEKVVGWLRQDIEYVSASGVPQDGIRRIKRETGIDLFDMVLIDGSEFTGMAELDEVYGAKYILLDDINGFKNRNNYQRLREDASYRLLYENWGIRNGYAVFQREQQKELPIHFFTIVLNGVPFIKYHLDAFENLPFEWHWHIMEGVADLKHDTAWSAAHGGRITDELHRNGLSNDGTSEYLDELARSHPEQVTIYRKPANVFWDGKLEMVNAPLENISEECLLWQVDADELWTAEQIIAARKLFTEHPEKSAAYYLCRFFVGEQLIITSRETYGNNTSYEWLRTWRFQPGMRWAAHEPPRLCRLCEDGRWTDISTGNCLSHAETEASGLIFQHFAYATEAQLRFKEVYYGYRHAVSQWRSLQETDQMPAMLRDFFEWVTDGATVNSVRSQGVHPMARRDAHGNWRFCRDGFPPAMPSKILWFRTDSIGDNVLASAMLPHLRNHYANATITVVCQEHIAELYEASPFVDAIITFDKNRALRDEQYLLSLPEVLRKSAADLTLNTLYSREPLNDFLAIGSGADERIAFHGNLCNITADNRDSNNHGYTRLISSAEERLTELERHREFLRGVGVTAPPLMPVVWTTPEDEDFAERFFLENHVQPDKTIALFPCAQWDVKLYPRYGEALAKVVRTGGFTVIGIGAKDNGDIIQAHLDHLGVKSMNLAGTTTLRQTAVLLRRCRLAVGADSASAHIACAVGTPNVVVLGGGHFGRFFPYSPLTTVVCLPLSCFDCNWKCPYPTAYCIKGIAPEMLAAAVRGALERTSGIPRVYAQGSSVWSAPDGGPCRRQATDLFPADSVDLIVWDSPEAQHEMIERQKEGGSPLISVITPSFNQAQFIGQTIQSVMNQEYPDYEHIVIDGGSDDGTLDILKVYPHLKWLSEKDRGQSDAVNKGFRMATGDIIAWINSDDWYEPGAFRAVADYFIANPEKNIVMGDCNLIDATGVIFDRVINHERGFDELKKHWISRSIPTQPALFFRRKLLDEFGVLDESLHFAMDYDLWMRFAQRNRFYHLEQTVANYRFHSDAKGGDQDWSKFIPDCLTVYDRYCPPRVSVVIPCYNYANYLGEALQSVINQTFRELEIIIVNDGSTDNTVHVAEQIIAAHPQCRIRLITQANSGQPAASRNRGISEARGEYILPLDADDIIHPTMLQKMVDILEGNDTVDIVYSDTIRFGDTNNSYRTEEWDLQRLATVNIINYCALFRRKVWEEVGGYRLDCGYEDWDFWISAAEKGFKGYRIPEYLFYYRIKQSGRLLQDQQNDSKIKAMIVRNHPNLYDDATKAWSTNLLSGETHNSKPLRVLFVVHNFPPHWFAGVEIYTFHLATSLIKQGIDVSVLYPLHRAGILQPKVEEDCYEGITVFRLLSDHTTPQHANLSSQISNEGAERTFTEFLSQRRFDIIHFHHTLSMPFSFIKVARQQGYPVCVTLHDFWFLCVNIHLYNTVSNTICSGPSSVTECATCLLNKLRYPASSEEKETLKKWIDARVSNSMDILQNAECVVSPSHYLADIHRNFGLSRTIEISPLGLNPVKRSSRATGSPVVFGFLGNIHDLKNVYMLVESFREVCGEARLIYFGAGAPLYLQKLSNAIEGDARIEYRGGYSPDQLAEVLEQVDIVVVPSITENYPLVVREALSAGVPVIASRVGGIPEIVTHLRNGILFDPTSKEELRKWLQTITDTPSLIQELKQNILPVKTMEQDAGEWANRYARFHRASTTTKPIQRVAAGSVEPKLKVAVFSLDAIDDACAVIRLVAPLQRLGKKVTLFWGASSDGTTCSTNLDLIEAADILVIQRFYPRNGTLPFIERMLASGKPVIYESDDLITDLPESNHLKPWAEETATVLRSILPRFTAVTTSTPLLAEAFFRYNPNVFAIPNLVDETLFLHGKTAVKNSIKIGFCGTGTHAGDLGCIDDALFRIADKYGDRVSFLFMGYATPGHAQLPGFTFIDFERNYESYGKLLSSSGIDIALVPLNDNSFNCCKSNIKWLEYSACGIAGIYADLQPYNTCIEHGKTGLLVDSAPDKWFAAICLLIEHPEIRQEIARRARETVLSHYSLESGAQKHLDTYGKILDDFRHRDSVSASPGRKSFSIIIPLFNQVSYTNQCLDGIMRNTGPIPYELVLVDNGSTDGTGALLTGRKENVKIITNPHNLGFARACNQGAAAATGDYLVFLNNDTIPQPGWLEALAEAMETEKADICGARLLYPDGKVQHAGVAFDEAGIGYHIFKNLAGNSPAVNNRRFMQSVTGACMLISKGLFQELSGFDESFFNGYEDIDLCLRAGLLEKKILYVPESVLIHFEERSEGRKSHDDRNMKLFLSRWGGKIRCDDDLFYRKEGYIQQLNAEGNSVIRPFDQNNISD